MPWWVWLIVIILVLGVVLSAPFEINKYAYEKYRKEPFDLVGWSLNVASLVPAFAIWVLILMDLPPNWGGGDLLSSISTLFSELSQSFLVWLTIFLGLQAAFFVRTARMTSWMLATGSLITGLIATSLIVVFVLAILTKLKEE